MREPMGGRSRLSRMSTQTRKRSAGDTMTVVAAPAARRTVEASGMRSHRWLFLALLLVPLASGLGETVRTNVQVTAVVLPHARIEEAATTPILVDALDVARGYVDVTRQYRLRTNSPDRVLLHVHPRLGYTQAVDVNAFGATLRLVDTSLELTPGTVGPFVVSYRLWLAPGVTPGTYPLPVQVAASVR